MAADDAAAAVAAGRSCAAPPVVTLFLAIMVVAPSICGERTIGYGGLGAGEAIPPARGEQGKQTYENPWPPPDQPIVPGNGRYPP